MSSDKLKQPQQAYKAPNEPIRPRLSSESSQRPRSSSQSSKTPFELESSKTPALGTTPKRALRV
ncbi:hypothetical protein L211DRAFT_841754, partial [Terfezia boudieri ATCC MYA-4762]